MADEWVEGIPYVFFAPVPPRVGRAWRMKSLRNLAARVEGEVSGVWGGRKGGLTGGGGDERADAKVDGMRGVEVEEEDGSREGDDELSVAE
jgi:hypothetical protein